jgi:calcium permeable stress-gated cation channel
LGVFRADYETIKAANGLDSYFFVRFLWMIVRILLPVWPISWIVLMPVDAVNTGVAGNTGLDIFTFGNVGKDQQARYAAHLIMAWLFTCKL